MGTYVKMPTRQELEAREARAAKEARARTTRNNRIAAFFAGAIPLVGLIAGAGYMRDHLRYAQQDPAPIAQASQATGAGTAARAHAATITRSITPSAQPRIGEREEFIPEPSDGAYILVGSFANPENAKALAHELTAEGYNGKMQRIERGDRTLMRVLVPYRTEGERKGIERHLEEHERITSTNLLEIRDGDERFQPRKGSSIQRYETLDAYLHGNGGRIERLPYYKEVLDGVRAARTRHDIVDEEKFITLFYANIWVESNFDPNAVSRVGATGLAQVYDKETLRGLGFRGRLTAEDKVALKEKAPHLFDVSRNLREGASRLAFLVDHYRRTHGDPYSPQGRAWVSAASNWGIGNLREQGMGNAPRETRNHVIRVADAYNKLARSARWPG